MQVHSGGILRATPHYVRSAAVHGSQCVSRNTFAVFMQPGVQEPLACPEGTVQEPKGSTLQCFYSIYCNCDHTLQVPLLLMWQWASGDRAKYLESLQRQHWLSIIALLACHDTAVMTILCRTRLEPSEITHLEPSERARCGRPG